MDKITTPKDSFENKKTKIKQSNKKLFSELGIKKNILENKNNLYSFMQILKKK